MASPSSPRSPETFTRGAPGYDEARAEAIWNARLAHARSPEAIVRCCSAEDVVAAVARAHAAGQKVALRGSGHSYIAAPLRDDGLLLDLGALDFLELDETTCTARVGPGVRGGDLIAALEFNGLAFPIGHCSTVALGGYLLAGGIGWNCGEWGPACNSVRAVEVVTAGGEIVLADESRDTDLLWAARGGGGGLPGAIVAFHLDLKPLPPAAMLWTASFTAESAPHLADWLTSATAAAAPEAEIMCLVGQDLKSGAPSITVRAVAVGDDAEQAAARIAAFRSPPPKAELTCDPEERQMGFHELTRLSHMPDGMRVAADQCWSDASLGELLMAVSNLPTSPSKASTINLVSNGGHGRIARFADGTGALSAGGGISCGIYGMWDDPAEDALHLAWVRQVDRALEPFESGRYVGEADLEAAPNRLAACYSAEALARLQDIRQRWDPAGLFHHWPGS